MMASLGHCTRLPDLCHCFPLPSHRRHPTPANNNNSNHNTNLKSGQINIAGEMKAKLFYITGYYSISFLV